MAFKGRPCMNVKRSLLCTEPALSSGCRQSVWPLWFPVAVMCIMESPWMPLPQTPVLVSCKLKNHSAYQKHTWVARTLSHIQTHITQIHSFFSQQLVQWFCIPSSMSEVGGYRRKRQQWGKHKNSWEILHRQVPVQNTTVSLSNSLACA